jgi:hypothetical protein
MKVFTVLFQHQCDEHFLNHNKKMFISLENAKAYQQQLLLEKETIDQDSPEFPFSVERAILIEEEVY